MEMVNVYGLVSPWDAYLLVFLPISLPAQELSMWMMGLET
jgi:hypothetical protein